MSDYDRTKYVHHLLLQTSDGAFYLLLWHEIADEDTSVIPHRPIQPPALPATLTLPPSIGSATVYAYDFAETLQPTVGRMIGGQLSLSIPDQVLVVKLSPRRTKP